MQEITYNDFWLVLGRRGIYSSQRCINFIWDLKGSIAHNLLHNFLTNIFAIYVKVLS